MSPEKCNGYSHLSQEDRFKIQFGVEAGNSVAKIARDLGVNRSTVSREIKRNSVVVCEPNKSYKKYQSEFVKKVVYDAQVAQQNSRECRFGNFKLDRNPGLMDRINALLANKLHPTVIEQQIGRAVCFKTMYNYIIRGLLKPGRVRQRKKRTKSPPRVRKKVLGVGIEHRPAEIEKRETFGHIEGDLVVGKAGSKEVWLTLVERKSRNGFVYRLPDRKAETTLAALQHFVNENTWAKSITFDNGSEFSLAHTLPIPTYFAHPYSSWERGSNENFNRLLRRELPKGRNLATYNDTELEAALTFINNLPRKLLDFKSAAQLLYQELHAS